MMLMSIDTEEDFAGMKKIGEIVANCLEWMKSQIQEGMTTSELDHLGGTYLQSFGAISAPIQTYSFPGSTCISLETEGAHGVPTKDRKIKNGDLINIDVSASLNGYFADNGESFAFGRTSSLKKKLCEATYEALSRALSVIRSGVKISRVGEVVEKTAKRYGFTVIQNLGGHGLGRSLHEEPTFIPSFFDAKDLRVFSDKQVVAIEPFLSNGARVLTQKNDGWTLYHPVYYTAQKEHTVMVTEKEPYVFTKPTKTF